VAGSHSLKSLTSPRKSCPKSRNAVAWGPWGRLKNCILRCWNNPATGFLIVSSSYVKWFRGTRCQGDGSVVSANISRICHLVIKIQGCKGTKQSWFICNAWGDRIWDIMLLFLVIKITRGLCISQGFFYLIQYTHITSLYYN
jgi:hypothetical protein